MSLNDRIEGIDHPHDGIPNAPRPLPGRDRRKSLAYTLVAAAREPMAVLDSSFRVTAANRSYHQLLSADVPGATGRPFCEPSAPNWSASALQVLNEVVALDLPADDVEMDFDVPGLGVRRMLLNARKIVDRDNPADAIVVGLSDVTDLRQSERATIDAADQHALLLQEAHHRIANSLQIIASILLLKARSVESQETRMHLRDVHKRLILVASVQRQLCSSGLLEEVEFGPYIAQLCAGLADSMTDGDYRVAIMTASSGGMIKADDAVSFGLIVTELVLNALKHGFPDGRRGAITVNFDANGTAWRLTVSDDGIGYTKDAADVRKGLGANIVEALAHHLKARVEIAKDGIGSSTSIVHSERAA